LSRLIQLCAPKCPQLGALVDRVDLLTQHAVQLRYPDDWREVELDEMNEMMALAKEFAAVLLPMLGR
ncbi:HEPN domain-containing protein, partial [Candidatus Sumerlaeota bacterium]|nr:HEPN domain-containing protein [Candidatus Sumerlaeota bacterium]